MEDFVRKSLLFDFYGELLTDYQKEIYRKSHTEDLSLAEIAQEYTVSRQAIYDILKRCDKLLENYEERLQLLTRFTKQKQRILEIQEITREQENEKMKKVFQLTEEILAEL